ncbi:hypothetical protein FJZ36_06590 [Candidatus Poribacteria bacterium]|nr:hypothetical protein [Candidatus Poribacteria bacterium]
MKISVNVGGSPGSARLPRGTAKILLKGTGSPHFRPVAVGGLALFVLTLILVRTFRLDTGVIAVVVGACALVGLLIYLRLSARRAREELERKRSEFYSRFEDTDPHDS